MPSLKSAVFHVMLRYRHLLGGKLRREVITQSTCVQTLRAQSEQSAARMAAPPEGVRILPCAFPAFHARWIVPEGAPEEKLLLYFHGGGFVMGSSASHSGLVAKLARRCGVKALLFDYSLAPEHPAPAAVYDGAAIYEWLLAQGFAPQDIVFAGDSAGGGVALGTLMKCRDDGRPMPAACVLFSPCTDATLSGESHKTRRRADPCTPPGANETYLAWYRGEGDPRHPYASPLLGDMRGLPPLMFQVGNDETLRDDSVRFAQKARQAGVAARLHVWKGMFHCFALLAPAFPEATAALSEACAFIREKLGLPA